MFSVGLKFVVALPILACVFCQDATWQVTSCPKVTSMIGVYARQKNEAYGAMMDNTLGAGLIHTADYGATGDYIGPIFAMNMGVTFTSNEQVGCVVGINGIFVGGPEGNYTQVPKINAVSQDVEPIGVNGFGVTGSFLSGKTKVNGVAYSLDSGNTWDFSDIGLTGSYIARYGSFPSESTWFVASGGFPSDGLEVSPNLKRLSRHIVIESNIPSYVKPSHPLRTTGDGYTGGISKTTDGGKTWKQVYDANEVFYFNEISCADDLHCIAVGENDDGYVVGTSDGGDTWNTLLTTPGISLIAARMLSPTEAWISGGTQNAKRQMVGYYYHTTDGGVTWELKTGDGYAVDLSFKDGVGYSAVISSSAGTIAVYK